MTAQATNQASPAPKGQEMAMAQMQERLDSLEKELSGYRSKGMKPPRPKLRPQPPDKADAVKPGSIYKHWAETEFYCVLGIKDGEITYAVEKSYSPARFSESPHHELRKGCKSMSLANAEGLVLEGKWLYVENIERHWK